MQCYFQMPEEDLFFLMRWFVPDMHSNISSVSCLPTFSKDVVWNLSLAYQSLVHISFSQLSCADTDVLHLDTYCVSLPLHHCLKNCLVQTKGFASTTFAQRDSCKAMGTHIVYDVFEMGSVKLNASASSLC